MLLSDIGEAGLLAKIEEIFAPTAGDEVRVGIGDDAAVIEPPAPDSQEVWATDLLVEGVHFQPQWQEPRELGHKSLAVNLSDIASMGAAPRLALISLAVGAATEVDFILEICRGLRDLALKEKVAVVGGDLSSSIAGLVINVSVGGVTTECGAILRSGAKEGDRVLVTGYPGMAHGGMTLLSESRADMFPELRKSFVAPDARTAAGRAAARAGATAMIDISDGLAGDFLHICEQSSVGGELDLLEVPVHPELLEASGKFGWNLEDVILEGGEDYELLFTLPPKGVAEARKEISAQAGVPAFVIGVIKARQDGVDLIGLDGSKRKLIHHGFNHFQRED